MFHKSLLTAGLVAGVFGGTAFAQEANQSTTEGLEQMVNVTITDQAVLDGVLEGQGEYGPDLALPVTVPTDVGTAAAVCGIDEATLAQSSPNGRADVHAGGRGGRDAGIQAARLSGNRGRQRLIG